MKIKKKLLGGYIENPIKQVEVFFSLIILGYFGVKIVYGTFFKFYPQKYYYRNIEINTNEKIADSTGTTTGTTDETTTRTTTSTEENTQKLVLNAYMPGMWNNEITDFIVTIVLSLVIFIYTSLPNRNMISETGSLNPALLFGFLLGCGYPPINHNLTPLINNVSKSSMGANVFNCIGGIIFIFLVSFVIISNYSSINNESNLYVGYFTYVAAIILILFGLYISRKKEETINKISYNYSQGSTCNTNVNNFAKSSGEKLNISVTFIVFILLLLFSFSPSKPSYNYAYTFIYGLFLGIFVSGISYYGIEYFLIKQPEKSCNTYAECAATSSISNLDSEEENEIINDHKYDNNSISLIKLMLVICLLIILVYLGYKYISK